MSDLTKEVILKQINGMKADLYEIGVFSQRAGEMYIRTWDPERILKSVGWLKYKNVTDSNIFIRPFGEHHLSMIDDLNFPTIERMKTEGFQPAVVVETSPGNFQAWLSHGWPLEKDLSTAVGREITKRYGGDQNAASWRQFGRLAGFTNRKEKHQRPDGTYPYVGLIESTGRKYDAASNLVLDTKDWLDKEKARLLEQQRKYEQLAKRMDYGPRLKSIDDFRKNPKYEGDGNRIDQAYALYARSHGVSERQIAAAIRSRDLSKKGGVRDQENYVQRTIRKAAGFTMSR